MATHIDKPERIFTMDLTPFGAGSCVLMDGEDISNLLRGIVVRSTAGGPTEVELQPAHGCRAQLSARIPEARISINCEPGHLMQALLRRFIWLTEETAAEIVACVEEVARET